jgi:PAS domain S-box-containing protein
MLSVVRNWLNPPIFAEDENKTHVARMLHAILMISMGCVPLYSALLLWIAHSEMQRLTFAFLAILAIPLAFGILILMQRGFVYLASMLLVSLVWLNLTIAAVVDGSGISGSSLQGYILIVIVAGLLIGWKASFAFAGLNMLSGLALIYAKNAGLFIGRATIQTSYTIWTAQALFSLTAAFVLGFALERINEAVQRAELSESYYRMLFEEAPDGILVVDEANHIVMANAVVHQITGYPVEELIGHSAFEFVDPENLDQRPPRPIEEIMASGTLNRERVLICKDGSRVHVVVSGRFMPDGYLQFIIQDITERKRMEKDLLLSEQRYRMISSAISDYAFSNFQNDKGEIVIDWVMGALEKISGYSVEEFNARGGWASTVHPDDLEQDERDMESLRNNQKVVSELRTIHKDGSIRWVRSYTHPVWDYAKNQLIGIYGAVQDITERKKTERERECLIKELESKNAELERFAYTVSHDLKAPLITIKGFLGFVREDALSGNARRLEADIQRIGEAADKMHALLKDLLELSRIGRMMNTSEAVAFADLLKDALELIHGRLQERNIKINISARLPVVFGDRQRLLEVVQNLLDNAAKFMGNQTDPQIEIGMQGYENNMPVIYVRDNGIGVAPQFHERIFGLFNRLDQKVEGTGIGLTLVKRIIETHGGRIWVESEAGQGATFFFTLPKPEK